MKLIFTGSGSAFTVGEGNFQSNMLLENPANKNRLLLDCGADARLALYELGLTYRDFQDVYISNLHSDHIGGLEWLAFTTKFDPSCTKKIRLHIKAELADTLWNSVLAGGLCSLQGIVANLSTYFDVCPINFTNYFDWEGIRINIAKPVLNGLMDFKIPPNYGIFFKINTQTVFITTNAQLILGNHPDHILEVYRKSDIIFQICEMATPWKNGVHANYEKLNELDAGIKKKMWLYHYNPGLLPDPKKDGFRGFVKKGQIFDLANPKLSL